MSRYGGVNLKDAVSVTFYRLLHGYLGCPQSSIAPVLSEGDRFWTRCKDCLQSFTEDLSAKARKIRKGWQTEPGVSPLDGWVDK